MVSSLPHVLLVESPNLGRRNLRPSFSRDVLVSDGLLKRQPKKSKRMHITVLKFFVRLWENFRVHSLVILSWGSVKSSLTSAIIESRTIQLVVTSAIVIAIR